MFPVSECAPMRTPMQIPLLNSCQTFVPPCGVLSVLSPTTTTTPRDKPLIFISIKHGKREKVNSATVLCP